VLSPRGSPPLWCGSPSTLALSLGRDAQPQDAPAFRSLQSPGKDAGDLGWRARIETLYTEWDATGGEMGTLAFLIAGATIAIGRSRERPGPERGSGNSRVGRGREDLPVESSIPSAAKRLEENNEVDRDRR
jgi:hypothetical protein